MNNKIAKKYIKNIHNILFALIEQYTFIDGELWKITLNNNNPDQDLFADSETKLADIINIINFINKEYTTILNIDADENVTIEKESMVLFIIELIERISGVISNKHIKEMEKLKVWIKKQ